MYSIKPNIKIVVLISAIFYLYTYLCVCLCVCVCARHMRVSDQGAGATGSSERPAAGVCRSSQCSLSNPATSPALLRLLSIPLSESHLNVFLWQLDNFFFNSAEVMAKIQLKIYYYIRSFCEDDHWRASL